MISFFLSLFAGFMASLTPCVAVLFPIALYRFVNNKKIIFKEYISYVLGFILVFLIFGLIFDGIANSIISSGFRLFLSVSLVILGILQLMKKINPLNIHPVKNSFLFGGIFAFAIAINPCTLPYLGSVIGLSINFDIILNLILFGVGMLLPSTLLVIVGGRLIHHVNRIGSKTKHLDKFMASLLIIAGTYLGVSILNISKLDVLFSSGSLLLLIGFIIYWLWKKSPIKNWKSNIPRISLITSLLLLWITFTYHCYSKAFGLLEGTCSIECQICTQCALLFIGASLFGVLGIIWINWFEERFKKIGNRR